MTELPEETRDGVTGPAADSREMLGDVRREVLALLAELPRPPTALRVQASGVAVEVTWGGGTHTEPWPAGPGQPAQAPAGPQAIAGGASPGGAAAGAAEQEDVHYVCAQTVGVFYRAAQPGAKPLMAEGDLVSVGEQVAIVEAMKLFLPVEADRDGRIVRFLVADGSSIEFGERLIALEEVT